MSSPYLSVIIPAYNEETRLPRTLLAVDHYLSMQKYSYEILVVNDGSKDNTAHVLKRFETLVSHLRFLDNKENHGKGYVVRQAMLEAQGEIRLFMDADNATTIDHVEKMIPLFEGGADVVIGSRDSKDAPGAQQAISQPFFKRLLGNCANLLIQIVAVPGIWDTQAGFKACTAHATQEIFSRANINRWGFDIEMLALARSLNFHISVIPTYWVNDPNTHVKLSGYLNTFRELFIVRWNLWTDAYHLPHIPQEPMEEKKESLVSVLGRPETSPYGRQNKTPERPAQEISSAEKEPEKGKLIEQASQSSQPLQKIAKSRYARKIKKSPKK